MTQTYFLIIVVALFLLIIWGNSMYRKAVKSLSPDKQIDLSEVQRSYQMWTIGIVIAGMALFFLLQKMQIVSFALLAIGFVLIIFLIYGFIAYKSYEKMKSLDFEPSFLKSFILSNAIRLFAILVLLAVVLLKEMVFKG